MSTEKSDPQIGDLITHRGNELELVSISSVPKGSGSPLTIAYELRPHAEMEKLRRLNEESAAKEATEKQKLLAKAARDEADGPTKSPDEPVANEPTKED